jgi:dTDP-glucose pyrophosphorylase
MTPEEKRILIGDIMIPSKASLLDALKAMDRNNVKLLIVHKGGKYLSLLSIGDVQRAIIKNIPFTEAVEGILRTNVVVARDSDPIDDVKKMMLERRIECMPVLDERDELRDVLFWDEVFVDGMRIPKEPLDLPTVIMAGGQGLRLRPLTNVIPKALIPVGDRSIIEDIIERFAEIGARRFYVTVNHKREMVEFYLKNSPAGNYDISYVREDKPLGTVGSLYLLKETIKETFFVTNCDILIDQDYREIYEYHKKNGNDITIIAAVKSYRIPYGILEAGKNGILSDLQEKPEQTFLINSGMYVLEPKMMDAIPVGEYYNITDLIASTRERGGRVGVFPISEKSWYDVGEWDEYKKTLYEYGDRVRGKRLR